MRVITKKILVIHFGLLLAEALCVSAFLLEVSRALSGNLLSWAYVVEWPIFALYAVYVWHKLLREDRYGVPPPLPIASDDGALDAYNAYLRRIHGSPDDHETLDS